VPLIVVREQVGTVTGEDMASGARDTVTMGRGTEAVIVRELRAFHERTLTNTCVRAGIPASSRPRCAAPTTRSRRCRKGIVVRSTPRGSVFGYAEAGALSASR
jgi:hypothetical protein